MKACRYCIPTICLAAMLVCFFTARPATARDQAHVSAVIDGDTVELDYSGYSQQADLADIDAPELRQPFGRQARQYLSGLILNKTVTVTSMKTEKGSRAEVELYVLDGRMRSVNRIMVKNGYAWSLSGRYAMQEKLARRAHAGLWSQNRPLNPAEFRRQQERSQPKKKDAEHDEADERFDEIFIENYYRRQESGRDRVPQPVVRPVKKKEKLVSFNGVSWGAHIQTLPDMIPCSITDAGGKKAYRKNDDRVAIGSATVDEIYYLFSDGLFCEVRLVIGSQKDFKHITAKMKEKFSKYKTLAAGLTVWDIQDIEMTIDWNYQYSQGSAVIVHTPLCGASGLRR